MTKSWMLIDKMARPSITLKLATSMDGKIALANGASEWITSEPARAAGRKLRAAHHAICVGARTAHIDNPQLTTRITGQPNPVRVIFDSRAALSLASNLAKTAREIPVILFCDQSARETQAALEQLGVIVLPVGRTPRGLDIAQALSLLRQRGIDSMLIEGGGRLAASFMALGVIDRIEWFRAPIILGGDGRDAIGDLGLSSMADIYRFTRVQARSIGDDLHETYQRQDV